MSRIRQPVIPATPDGTVWVRSFAVRFTEGYFAPLHDHEWHQLSYASAGVLRIATCEGTWVAPPHRAVWIPAGVEHREEIRGNGAIRSLYFAAAICGGLPTHCAVLNVPDLLRELILEVAERSVLDAAHDDQKRLAQVIADRLALLRPAPTQVLPMPRDRRALAIAAHLQAEPASEECLDVLARRAGASVRTVQRLFTHETGMSFAQWRQRLRLLAAVESLGVGRSVTDAAFDVGYTSVSAFVSAFRREFGVTPGRFGQA